MLYAPALPYRIRVDHPLIPNLILLGIIGLAPVFVVSAWPLAALPALALLLLYSNIPPRRVWMPAALAALAAFAAPPALAVGYLWLLAFLVLTVGSFQTLPVAAVYDALIISGVVHTILGPVSFTDGRLVGWLGNANLAGSLLSVCLVLAIMRRRWLFAGIIGAGLLATGSIGAWIGAAAGIGFILLSSNRARKLYTPARLIILATVATAAGGLLLAATWRSHWLRLRPLQWATGIGMTHHAPILGMGPGSFPDIWAGVSAQKFTHAHNFYIHVLAESGIIGALALAAVGVWAVWKVRGPALVGLIVLAVHGLVDATALHPVIAWLAAALIGIGRSPREDKRSGVAIILAGGLLVLSPLATGIVQMHY